jgi:hypothetical protein
MNSFQQWYITLKHRAMQSCDRNVDQIYNSTRTGGTVLWTTKLLARLRLIIAFYVVLGDHDEQADGSKYPLYGPWLGMMYTTMCGYKTTKCMTTAVSFISKILQTSLQLPAPRTDNERTSDKAPRITCIKCQLPVRSLVGSTVTTTFYRSSS